MAEKEFPKGLMVRMPREGAPEFLKFSISIKRAEFGNWLREKKDQEWINLDVKVSKEGKLYAEVNNWKPKEKKEEKANPKDFDDVLPF